MEGQEWTFMFHLSANHEKITQKYIKASLQFQYKQLCKEYKDAKAMETHTKYHVIHTWWISSWAINKEGMYMLLEWLGF